MILRTLLAAILATALAACTSLQMGEGPGARQPSYPPDTFAHRVATSHLVLFWNCSRPELGILQVDGLAFNPWSDQPIRFLAFDLVGVDSGERTVSQVEGEARDFLLGTNRDTPFRLDLRTAGTETRFDLFYRYRFQDSGRSIIAGQGFAVPHLLAQMQQQFSVRDACSETQHLAR